jgi:putative hydrolase of the HAD superfamily
VSDSAGDPVAEGRPASRRAGRVAAVLFDYGMTLVHFERPTEAIEAAQAAIASEIEGAGHPRPDVGVLRKAVHDRVESEVAAHEAAGALEEIDVTALEERAFADIGLHLDASLRDRCSVLVQEAWWHGVRPYPDAAPVLRALRGARMRVGLCSNAAYRSASMHQQLAHVGLGALLDAAVFSAEVGWRKPSPRLFGAALQALGTRADETVFVGDRVREDIRGAASAGMRTVLIARDSAAHQPAPSEIGADQVIHSLAELPALLVDMSRLRQFSGRKSGRVYTRRASPTGE